MTPEERAQLEAVGTRLAEDYPAEKRAGFVADYVEIAGRLNGQLAILVDEFKVEAAALVSAYVPFNPRAVAHVIAMHTSDLTTILQAITVMFSKVGDSATRGAMARGLRAGIRACLAAAAELGRRNEARNGTRLA